MLLMRPRDSMSQKDTLESLGLANKSGVRMSFCPSLSPRLNWCDSGWWRCQLNAKGRVHKKNRKKCGPLPNRGGGRVSEGSKMPNLYFGKVFFQVACRIILGPPKHVLHLVWSCLNIYLALKTTLKVSLNSYLTFEPKKLVALLCWLFWTTMIKGNLFVFEVGPSVKFVSAIKDAIFNNNKNGSFP